MKKIIEICYQYAFPISVIFLISLWEFVPKYFQIPPYIFPKISDILNNTSFSGDSLLFLHIKITTIEALLGFMIGSLIAFICGILIHEIKIIRKIALPYVIASNAIPIVAIAPIIILWFGNGIASKTAVAAFLCFFPLCINTYKGLNEFNPLYQEFFKIYGATRLQFLIKFKLPNALPYIITGLKLNAVYAVIGAIVAEFIGSDRGLGFGMLQASYSLNIPKLWSYIIIACALGLLFYTLIYLLEKIILNFYNLKSK